MTTKIEPTVEKWEELKKAYNYFLATCPDSYYTTDYGDGTELKEEALLGFIQSYVSLSVQEAKAESDRIKEMIAGYNQEKLILTESLTTPRFDSNAGRATRHSIEARLREVDKILSTLNTKSLEVNKGEK